MESRMSRFLLNGGDGATTLDPGVLDPRSGSLCLWRWRTREGELLAPSEMATSHLFFTLRMIWNNSMPPHMAVGRVRRYSFDPRFYTRDYFAQAILAVGRELSGRTDLTADQQRQLSEMRDWLQAFGTSWPKMIR